MTFLFKIIYGLVHVLQRYYTVLLQWRLSTLRLYVYNRADGAGPVAQAMAGPIFETFQGFLSGHMFGQAGNMRACRPQAKCRDARLM